MKLLMVSPTLPRPTWGFGTRSYHLLKALACEHSVSLLALVDKDEVEVSDYLPLLKELTHTLQVIPRPASHSKRAQQVMNVIRGSSYLLTRDILVEVQDALDALLAREQYDAVLFENVMMAGYRLPKGIKVIIDQHNIEHELLHRTYQRETSWFRKWYNWRECQLLKPVEIEYCRRADVVLVTSEREHLFWKSLLPESVIEVVPNGVDTETFRRDGPECEVLGRIIFTGAMNYYPNIDAVLSFAQQCWPCIQAQVPGATWQIVGYNPSPEVLELAKLPGITVTGSVPVVQSYLAQASVAIVPLRIGSGTRLKILEALAMQKAVVSTSIGCEGLSVTPGEHLLVADQPEAFVQAIVALMEHPQERMTLGKAGRLLVETRYSWQRCGSQLLQVLENMS